MHWRHEAPPTLCGEGGSSPWVQGLRGGDATDLMESFSEGADEHVAWGHPCPTPDSEFLSVQGDPTQVSATLSHLPLSAPREQHPHLQVSRLGRGPGRTKALLRLRHASLGVGGACGEQLDNSLLREHDGLSLDLAVQGQDVIVDERALRGERQRMQAQHLSLLGAALGSSRDGGWGASSGPGPQEMPNKRGLNERVMEGTCQGNSHSQQGLHSRGLRFGNVLPEIPSCGSAWSLLWEHLWTGISAMSRSGVWPNSEQVSRTIC